MLVGADRGNSVLIVGVTRNECVFIMTSNQFKNAMRINMLATLNGVIILALATIMVCVVADHVAQAAMDQWQTVNQI